LDCIEEKGEEMNSHDPEKPSMTTIGRRPANVLGHLSTIDGVYVQCRLPSGEDAHVPLKDIYTLFEKELANKMRMNQELGRS
jgi:hypothetical protein